MKKYFALQVVFFRDAFMVVILKLGTFNFLGLSNFAL